MSNLKIPYALILAAGSSTRMSTPKWKLKMPGGESFLWYIATGYLKMGVTPVGVISNGDKAAVDRDTLPDGVLVAVNSFPDKGRLYSLQCGLKAIGKPVSCFIHNVDNPFVSREMASAMESQLEDHDYVVPVNEGKGGHPILISASLSEQIGSCREPLPVLRDFLKNFSGYRLPVNDPRILLNINTPEAYRAFLSTPE